MLASQQTHGVQPVNRVRETTAVNREHHMERVSAMCGRNVKWLVLEQAVCSTYSNCFCITLQKYSKKVRGKR